MKNSLTLTKEVVDELLKNNIDKITDWNKLCRNESYWINDLLDGNIDKLTPHSLYNAVKDFSLEKTKATKDERQAAATTYEHPQPVGMGAVF